MTAARKFSATVRDRGYRPVHSSGCRCPGCGLSNWHIGRVSAECAGCGTALPLSPEARSSEAAEPSRPRGKLFLFRRHFPAPDAPVAAPSAAGAIDQERSA